MQGATRVATVLAAVALMATGLGCAVGNTYQFVHVPEGVERVEGAGTVLLFPVEEARPQVVDEGEPVSWVGEQRGGYGMPFNVLTRSGEPFAEVVTDALAAELEAAGFRVVRAEERPEGDLEQRIRAAGADRALDVVMREFNANTYVNIDVEWDFEATVYGEDGARLASDRERGKETLEGSFWNSPEAARSKVPPFFHGLMRDLVVGDPEMTEALSVP